MARNVRKNNALIILVSLFFLCSTSVFASSQTVDASHSYAWGENMGWINFAPENNGEYQGVVVTDASVTGYAWSKEYGWINFSPTNSGQGVSIDANGHLSGSAWVPNLGWLSMSGVTIGTDGKWSGIAGNEGDAVGRVNFDCNLCDVRNAVSNTQNSGTSSIAARIGSAGVIHSDSNFFPSIYPVVNHIVTNKNDPKKVFPNDSSNLSGLSHAKVYVPAGAYPQKITVTTHIVNATFDVIIETLGKVFFDIVAKDPSGKEIHTFSKPLTITLTVPESLVGEKIGVFWFDTTKNTWSEVPNIKIDGNTVTFSVSHLTRFAIMKIGKASAEVMPETQSQSNNINTKIFLVCAAIVTLLYVLLRRRIRE